MKPWSAVTRHRFPSGDLSPFRGARINEQQSNEGTKFQT